MFRLLLGFICLQVGTAGLSQLSVESSFNAVQATAMNQSLLLKYEKGGSALLFGFKYQFNSRRTDVGYLFKKMFYSRNLSERLGLEMGFQKKIILREKMDFFFYYDFQFTKSSVRHFSYLAAASLVPIPTSEKDFVYQKSTSIIAPVRAFENNIGFGFNLAINDQFYLTQKAGVGITLVQEFDPKVIFLGGDVIWFFSEMFSFGLGYTLKTKKS